MGYCQVAVGYPQKMQLIHVLVTVAFLGDCPNGKEVNHKNGDKSDNRLTNLEYVTHSENMKHAFASGLVNRTLRKATATNDTR